MVHITDNYAVLGGTITTVVIITSGSCRVVAVLVLVLV